MQKISYSEFWSLLKENFNKKWSFEKLSGNFWWQSSSPNYYKIIEILDIDEEDENGKNEAGYKRLYFEGYELKEGRYINCCGIPMDNWPGSHYEIELISSAPLSFNIKWEDKEEEFFQTFLMKEMIEEKTFEIKGEIDKNFKNWLHGYFGYYANNVLISNDWASKVIYQYDFEQEILKSSFNNIELQHVNSWRIEKTEDNYHLFLYSDDVLWTSFTMFTLTTDKINPNSFDFLTHEG